MEIHELVTKFLHSRGYRTIHWLQITKGSGRFAIYKSDTRLGEMWIDGAKATLTIGKQDTAYDMYDSTSLDKILDRLHAFYVLHSNILAKD